MYGIDEKIYQALMTYFVSNGAIQEVILFGSRAKGLETPTSDIDLCLKYQGISKGSVVFDIEDRAGIYSVDIVFEDRIGEELRKQIQRDGKIIYCQKNE